jgi:predicted signal transduction protein with EAL and GGDEF domain
MTILVEDIHYNVLEQLLRESDTISEDEVDTIIQVCIHILSGAVTKSEILGNFERPAKIAIHRGKFNKIVDQYKIIHNLINKIEKN